MPRPEGPLAGVTGMSIAAPSRSMAKVTACSGWGLDHGDHVGPAMDALLAYAQDAVALVQAGDMGGARGAERAEHGLLGLGLGEA